MQFLKWFANADCVDNDAHWCTIHNATNATKAANKQDAEKNTNEFFHFFQFNTWIKNTLQMELMENVFGEGVLNTSCSRTCVCMLSICSLAKISYLNSHGKYTLYAQQSIEHGFLIPTDWISLFQILHFFPLFIYLLLDIFFVSLSKQGAILRLHNLFTFENLFRSRNQQENEPLEFDWKTFLVRLLIVTFLTVNGVYFSILKHFFIFTKQVYTLPNTIQHKLNVPFIDS